MANLRRLDLLPNTRALTLIQPWAYAITNCGKDVENRSWPAPTGPGQRMHWASTLLIHAGKTVDLDDAHSTFTRLGCLLPPAPVTSAIVAVCRIAAVCAPWRSSSRCTCGPWAAEGQYHWQLADVFALPQPVAARGRQGLWRPEPDVLAAVEAQMHLVAADELIDSIVAESDGGVG
jgi:hypothetical protein